MFKLIPVLFLTFYAWISPVFAVELVMVDSPGCHYCVAWKQEIGPSYPNTAEGKFAPLHLISARDVKRSTLKLKRPVVYTPTFLVIDNNRELTRLEGYPGEDFFWFHLTRMLEEHTDFRAKSKTH